MLYKVTPIAVVGGSFLPSLAGHNFSEAAAAGCAVLTGKANVSTYLNLNHFFSKKIRRYRV
jgi:3-deoxy-D-manno-octulosonic-acid transferase